MRPTCIINFLAGPGVGKTTQSHALMTALKRNEKANDYLVQYVPESAKPYALAHVGITQGMQNMLYFETLKMEMQAVGLVDFIISECPTAVNLYYEWKAGNGQMKNLGWEQYKRSRQEFLTVDFWCPRPSEIIKPYNNEGRFQANRQEAEQVDAELRPFLTDVLGLDLIDLRGPEFGDEIFGYLRDLKFKEFFT